MLARPRRRRLRPAPQIPNPPRRPDRRPDPSHQSRLQPPVHRHRLPIAAHAPTDRPDHLDRIHIFPLLVSAMPEDHVSPQMGGRIQLPHPDAHARPRPFLDAGAPPPSLFRNLLHVRQSRLRLHVFPRRRDDVRPRPLARLALLRRPPRRQRPVRRDDLPRFLRDS